MGGAHAAVDVKAVGLDTLGDDVRPEFVEHRGRGMIGRPVGAIEVQRHALEVQPRREGALAKLHVTAAGVVQTAGFAQGVARDTMVALGDFRFDFLLDGVGELGALVLIGVVAGADHHTGVQTQGSGEVGNGRRGHGATEHDIDAGGRKTGLQGGFEHVARHTRVLADEHRGGRLAHRAAHAVGSEILSGHLGILSDATGTRVGSKASPTSVAPRFWAILASLFESLPNAQSLTGGGHVVHAHELRPPLDGHQGRGHARDHAFAGLGLVGDGPEKALARQGRQVRSARGHKALGVL